MANQVGFTLTMGNFPASPSYSSLQDLFDAAVALMSISLDEEYGLFKVGSTAPNAVTQVAWLKNGSDWYVPDGAGDWEPAGIDSDYKRIYVASSDPSGSETIPVDSFWLETDSAGTTFEKLSYRKGSTWYDILDAARIDSVIDSSSGLKASVYTDIASQILDATSADVSLGRTTIKFGGDEVNIGEECSGNARLQIGISRTADGSAFVDFTAASATSDFDARIIRESGTNGNLHIRNYGTGKTRLISESTGAIEFRINGTDRISINSSGDILALEDGTPNLGGASNRYDTVYATTGSINTSDPAHKRETAPIHLNVEGVLDSISGISYKMRGGHRVHTGFDAQQVSDFLDDSKLDWAALSDPKKVGGSGSMGLRYSEFVPVLWENVRILKKRLQIRGEEIARISNKVEDLTHRLDTLESQKTG